ncbi:MAG: AmmeMemoRadiSam system protein B, partial [Candidatus Cloacimonetes bacterium]|nr:AmmeMemoRadiSam system protein B [Candidatus Cloacimonadota bacterium]
VVEGLVKSGFANENNETVGSEHSVGGTMPYLAYYLSDTKVVPIILSSQTPLVKVQKLGDYLAQLMKGKNWIIVAPVDFAHEVTSQRAEANDAITEGLIRNFDFATLFTLSNEYLDSGPAIGVLLQAMQNIGATDVETLNHTNSGLLLGSQSFLVTSYFEMVFYQAEIPPLTIEGVFSANHEVADLPLGELRTLIVTGDVLLARSVNFQMHQQGDFRLPFQRTAEVLQGADLSLVNLENPIVKDCPLTNEGMVFCGSPEVVEGLTYAGVDIASLANNHCRDRGEAGLRETVNILEKEGIDTLVQGKILVKDVKGARFAFFGYDTVRIAVSDDEVRDSIKKAKSMADIVIVYFHWGVEYVDTPTQKQKDLAHLAIDSGADLVLGSHPHWVQGVEIYQDKLIVYSHGNFIFDQMFSKETKTGVIGRYTFYKEKLVDVEFLPVYMEKFPCPHLLIGDGGKAVLEQMRKRSL